MATSSVRVPQAAEINPILLWLFRHGWEDPSWGTRPSDQLTLALAIHELASHVTDATTRGEIHAATAKAVANLSKRIVESH